MKILPTALATLSLATGSLAQSPNTYALDGWETLGVVPTNEHWSDLILYTFKPEYAYIQLKQNMTLTEGRQITKAVFATFDFRNGITMEQADHLATTLGENPTNDRTWTKMYETINFGRGLSTTIHGTNLDKTGKFYENNPTDVIYFAVYEENPDDPSVEPKWVRGKWDYRTCAHASAPANETGNRECYMKEDTSTGKFYWVPLGNTKIEEVLSWEDELKKIGMVELNNLSNLLVIYEQQKASGQEITDFDKANIDYNFDMYFGRVKSMNADGLLADEMEALEARRRRLYDIDDAEEAPDETPEDNESDDEKGDGDDTETKDSENGEGDETEDGDKKDNGSGGDNQEGTEKEPETSVTPGVGQTSGNGGDSHINGGSSAPSEDTIAKDGANNLTGNNSDTTDKSVVKNTETEENVVKITTLEDGNGWNLQISDVHPEVVDLLDANNGLEVPNLGEVENVENSGGKWFWAVLIAALAALGVLGWRAGKYLFAGKRDKEEE